MIENFLYQKINWKSMYIFFKKNLLDNMYHLARDM
jgi:hypothetical protein